MDNNPREVRLITDPVETTLIMTLAMLKHFEDEFHKAENGGELEDFLRCHRQDAALTFRMLPEGRLMVCVEQYGDIEMQIEIACLDEAGLEAIFSMVEEYTDFENQG